MYCHFCNTGDTTALPRPYPVLASAPLRVNSWRFANGIDDGLRPRRFRPKTPVERPATSPTAHAVLYTLTNVVSVHRRVPSLRQRSNLTTVVVIDEVLMVMLAFSCGTQLRRQQLPSDHGLQISATRGSGLPVRRSSLVCHSCDVLWPKCLGERRFASCHTLACSKRITQ